MAVVCACANPAVDRLFAVDRLSPGAIHRPELLVTLPGGKGLNVARALTALGAEVVAVAIVGGHAGTWIEEALAEEGIEVRTVLTGAETRVCLSVADRSTGALTEFYEDPAPLDIDVWNAFRDLVVDALEDASHLAISGSLPPGAPEDGYVELLSDARRMGVASALDTRDGTLRASLGAAPDIVKINEHEAATLVGAGSAEAHLAVALLEMSGASTAIVTRGRDGAMAAFDDGTALSGRVDADGPYAVGSGDAFLAGFIAALLDGADRESAMALALGAGAANADVAGAGRLDAGAARDYAERASVSTIDA